MGTVSVKAVKNSGVDDGRVAQCECPSAAELHSEMWLNTKKFCVR